MSRLILAWCPIVALIVAAAAAEDGLWIVFTDRYGNGTFADTFIVNLSLLHSTGELAWE